MPNSQTYVRRSGDLVPGTIWDTRVRNEVWNTSSLAWESQTSGGDATAANQTTEIARLASILATQTDGTQLVKQKSNTTATSGTLSTLGDETVNFTVTGYTSVHLNFKGNTVTAVGAVYNFFGLKTGSTTEYTLTAIHTIAYDGQIPTSFIPDTHGIAASGGTGQASFRIPINGFDTFRLRGGGISAGTISYQFSASMGESVLDGILGTVYCNVGTSVLPTDAATETKQNTQITSLQLLDDAVASTGSAITTKGFAASGTDGTNARILKTDSSGELQVDVLTLPSVAIGNVPFATRSDTFTTTANGTTVSALTSPLKYFSVLVKMTGTVTSWDVRLEGSTDNSNFTQILQHTNVSPGDGLMVFSGSLTAPVLYFRSRVAGLVLGAGTNVIVTILGMN